LKRERWHGTGDFQSLANMVRSKLALVTVVFLALHLGLLVFLFLDARWAAACAAAIGLMTLAMSFVKFPSLKRGSRLKNAFLFYCYLAGRSWSLLSQLRFRALRTVPSVD